jgi:excisionase family DNA binding protein
MAVTWSTLSETAEYLRRSERAVSDLVARRQIPHRKVAGTRRLLFSIVEIDAWLDGASLETRELASGGRVVTIKAIKEGQR